MRTFLVLLLLLNLAYLAWNAGLMEGWIVEQSLIRMPALHAEESLQLLSEALLEGVELKEVSNVVNKVCIEPDFTNVDPLESLETQSGEKQQEKLCETIAPEL